MRATAEPGDSLAHDHTIANDEAADAGIGSRLAYVRRRKDDGLSHPVAIILGE